MKFITTAIIFLVAEMFAFAQGFQVGSQTLSYTDASRNRSVGIEFRFPGANGVVANGQFPFVIFAHGFQMDAVPYYPYADTLATHGFIVGLLTTETGLLPSHPDFAQDLVFAYNKLISENNNTASPFYQKVKAKGALGGHSMGGGSTVLSAQYGNPAVCYFSFAAANTNPSSIAAASFMTKPYLAFAGSRDCIAPIGTHQQPMYDNSGSSCKFLINILDGLHCQFGNGNFQCNLGEGLSFCASSPLSRSSQVNKTLYYLIPFLDYYLKGDCTAWTLFENRYTANNTDALQRSCTNTVPDTAFIVGENNFCQDSNTILRAGPAFFTYRWNDGTTSDSIVVSSPGVYEVVVGNGVCELSAVSATVTENPLPVIGSIVGEDSICAPGFSQQLYLSDVANADSIQWWTSGAINIVSGAETDTVVITHAGTGGTLYVSATNSCGTSQIVSLSITVIDTPIVFVIANGDTLSCLVPAVDYQWYLNGTAINGATADNYIAPQGGSYTVMITDSNGCSAASSPVIISGIENISEEEIVSIYPNPSTVGRWQLRVGSSFIGGEAEMFDADGRSVFKSEIRIPNSTLSLNVPNGVYLLRVSFGKATVTRRLVRL